MSGSIYWRCRFCGLTKSPGGCRHPTAKYVIQYRIGRKQKWKAVSKNKKEAERLLTEIQSQLYSGTYRELTPMTFDEFAEKWVKDYAACSTRPLTLRRTKGVLACYLKPAFGTCWLTNITPQMVQAYLAKTVQERGVSASTINSMLTTFKLILRHAKEWGYLRENPAEHVKRLKVEATEMGFLRPQEIPLLLQHAEEPYRTLFLTAILTGMRMGELLGLQWGDLDWVNHVIHVRRSLYWWTRRELAERGGQDNVAWRFAPPKSKKSIRAIPMSPRLQQALERHRVHSPENPHDLVFTTRVGTPMDRKKIADRKFKPALRQAGLRVIRFHDLRHTCASLLIAQGENPKVVQNYLGHASAQLTLDRYSHLMPQTSQQAAQKLDQTIFGNAHGANAAQTGMPAIRYNEAGHGVLETDEAIR